MFALSPHVRAGVATLVTLLLSAAAPAARADTVAETLAAQPGLVDAGARVPELQIDLRYATAENFLGRAVYGNLATCYLRPRAAAMLARAQALLMAEHPDWRLRVYDCTRPRSVQRAMWALVEGTPQQRYVADPARGSMHNFGCAVDITLATRSGEELDMGTPFDHFGPRARPDREAALLARGALSAEQVAHRRALRRVMRRAGFRVLASEWWHFECGSRRRVLRDYAPVP